MKSRPEPSPPSRRRVASTSSLATLCALMLTIATGCSYHMVADGKVDQNAWNDLLRRVSDARGLPAEDVGAVRVVKPAELSEILHHDLDAQWSAQDIEDAQCGLVALGLWPPGHSLLSESMELWSDEIAGLYSRQERTLYMVDGARTSFLVGFASALSGRDLGAEIVLGHEAVHAMQHQAYPQIMEAAVWQKWQDDAALATAAALEGDATRYGLQAIVGPRGLPAPEDLDLETLISQKSLAGRPRLVAQNLAFPYSGGYRLSYREGRRLLDSAPASSEQVLHDAKRHESFEVIDLAAVHAELPDGCAFVTENTVGELQMSVLFSELAPNTSPSAWEGWNGDRYVVARCGDRPEFLWVTSWDSEADAGEFASAYAGIAGTVQARASLTAPPRALVRGAEVSIFTPAFEALAEHPDPPGRWGRANSLEDVRRHFDGS